MKKTSFKRMFITISLLAVFLLTLIFVPLNSKVYAESKNNTNKTSDKYNKAPIVLVHGLLGWGRDQYGKTQYWGQQYGDIQEIFNSKGYKILTAKVSPISSNWHRACELYAYIKGGRVDYGKYMSEKLGHERYGRTYEGIYPQWDKDHPIHLIGHSQGGQTARVLAHLLEYGFDQEKDINEDISPLFEGNMKNSIISITTLATPHDGTTSADFANKYSFEQIHKLIPFLEKINGGHKIELMDYQLEYWGLHQKKGESFIDFLKRNKNNKAFSTPEAFALYDLTPQGAKKLNSWVKDSPNIYYSSIACQATEEIKIFNKSYYRIPAFSVDPGFRVVGSMMLKVKSTEPIMNNKIYKHNDGIVNSYSAVAPHLGRYNTITKNVKNYTEFEKGIWNNLPNIENCSHIQIIGFIPHKKHINIEKLYTNLFNTCAHLE